MRRLTLLSFIFSLAFAGAVTAQEKDTVKTVKTLPGAYFNSSCGNDRLGGSKMGFVSEDVVLEVEDATEELYKVNLSGNRYAYIPKEYVADTTVAAEALAVCPTSSLQITNQGKADRIRINLPVRKPYLIRENLNPHQLVIDVFGVQNNSNWMTHHLDLEAIENVEVIQSDSDVTTYVATLKNVTSWGYSAKYEENSLVVEIKHAPEFTLKGMTIGVDAGHGGPSSLGAIGRTTKAMEKELNLSMAYMVKEMLEAKGAKVVLSRVGDEAMTMAERKAKFLENEIDMMFSIHCNAAGGTAHGTSTYYKHIQNRAFAKTILERLVEIEGVDEWGLVGNFNFSLSAITDFPCVLVETLFISSLWEEEKLADPAFRKAMMENVAKGLNDYIKACRIAEGQAKK